MAVHDRRAVEVVLARGLVRAERNDYLGSRNAWLRAAAKRRNARLHTNRLYRILMRAQRMRKAA